jgi:O-antigen ligase
MSLSRSAYIAFGISLIYLFIAQKKWKELLISLTAFTLLIVVMPKPFGEGGNLLRTASIEGRMQDFSRGIILFQKKPILGYGYNRIRAAKELQGLIDQDDRSHSLASFHSSFLIILVTTGIVGFLSSMYLLVRLIQKFSYLRIYAIYLISMSVFDNVLLHALVMLPFLFIAAYSSLE